MSAFQLSDVCRDFDGTSILNHVTINIPSRQVTALIGPSGAGKSSLLRLLNRLDDPTSGMISYKGQSIAGVSVRGLRAKIGFVFQTPVMFPGTVRENLAVAAEIARVEPDGIDRRMRDSLQLAELEIDFLGRDASRLSVGQQQRVSIARTLMTRPETLLLDEPAASLDPETAERLMNTVARLSAEMEMTVVVATHRLVDAREMSEFVVMLDGGRVVEAGPTSEIFGQSLNPRVRSFLESVS